MFVEQFEEIIFVVKKEEEMAFVVEEEIGEIEEVIEDEVVFVVEVDDDEVEDESEEDEDEDEEEEEDEEEFVIVEIVYDDFDWFVDCCFGFVYIEVECKELMSQYEEMLIFVLENEIVKGKIIVISDGDVVLDIGFKLDGFVFIFEFCDMLDFVFGD